MNRPRLEILFGPIASGKSTYARDRALHGYLVSNDDAFTFAVHGGEYSRYDSRLKPLYKSLRSQTIHFGAALGFNVVVDSTGLRRSTRDHLSTLGRSLDMETHLVVFRGGRFSGEADGRRRWSADNRGLTREEWIDVAEHHARVHDPIGPDEWANYASIHEVPWVSGGVT